MRRTPSLTLLATVLLAASARSSSATIAPQADQITRELPQTEQARDFIALLHEAARLGE